MTAKREHRGLNVLAEPLSDRQPGINAKHRRSAGSSEDQGAINGAMVLNSRSDDTTINSTPQVKPKPTLKNKERFHQCGGEGGAASVGGVQI